MDHQFQWLTAQLDSLNDFVKAYSCLAISPAGKIRFGLGKGKGKGNSEYKTMTAIYIEPFKQPLEQNCKESLDRSNLAA